MSSKFYTSTSHIAFCSAFHVHLYNLQHLALFWNLFMYMTQLKSITFQRKLFWTSGYFWDQFLSCSSFITYNAPIEKMPFGFQVHFCKCNNVKNICRYARVTSNLCLRRSTSYHASLENKSKKFKDLKSSAAGGCTVLERMGYIYLYIHKHIRFLITKPLFLSCLSGQLQIPVTFTFLGGIM